MSTGHTATTPPRAQGALPWLLATRPQFLTAIGLPTLLGTGIAWWHTGHLAPGLFALALLAGLLAHAGANVLNDYFDHTSGADGHNAQPLTPFAGGSRMIQRGILSPAQTLWFGMGLLAGAAVIGLWLVAMTGTVLLWIGVAGLVLGYFYTAPPLRLSYRGLGEITVGMVFGAGTVLGATAVQTGGMSLTALMASVPVSLLAAAILIINEFPDHDADAKAGKRTLVVFLGARAARPLLPAALLSAMASIPLGVTLGLLPPSTLIALLPSPLAVVATRVLYAHYASAQHLIPAIKAVIGLHAAVTLLLTLAFALA